MVGEGTLGAQGGASVVTSPALPVTSGQQAGKLAWWVADESMKAHVVSGTERPEFARGGEVEALFAANAGISANSAGLPALGEIPINDPDRSKYLSAAQYELKNPEASSLFHDVTSYSRGLPVDVTRGRFKFDFSSFALLDRPQIGNLPLYRADGAVNRFSAKAAGGLANDSKFSVFNGGQAAMLNVFGDIARQPGIHLEELWTHANLYRNLTWTGRRATRTISATRRWATRGSRTRSRFSRRCSSCFPSFPSRTRRRRGNSGCCCRWTPW
jgi:hypothetical protein